MKSKMWFPGEDGRSGLHVLPQSYWYEFLYGTVLLILCLLVCLVGASIYAKATFLIFIIVMVVLITVFISFFAVKEKVVSIVMTDGNSTHYLNGTFTGFKLSTLKDNVYRKYPTYPAVPFLCWEVMTSKNNVASNRVLRCFSLTSAIAFICAMSFLTCISISAYLMMVMYLCEVKRVMRRLIQQKCLYKYGCSIPFPAQSISFKCPHLIKCFEPHCRARTISCLCMAFVEQRAKSHLPDESYIMTV